MRNQQTTKRDFWKFPIQNKLKKKKLEDKINCGKKETQNKQIKGDSSKLRRPAAVANLKKRTEEQNTRIDSLKILTIPKSKSWRIKPAQSFFSKIKDSSCKQKMIHGNKNTKWFPVFFPQ
jgi:hypothetical protein